jgi:hypothetical protein
VCLKAANSLSLALTLLAMQQLSGALVPDAAGSRVTLGQDFLDQLLQQMAALACDIFTLEASTPHYATKAALDLMLALDGFVSRAILGGENRNNWQEFQNKLQAFYLFEHIDSILNIVPGSKLPLPDLVEKASGLGPYYSVWAIEGLGHHYTNLHLQSNISPQDLLRDSIAIHLPKSSMLPLHAGMGLSFAQFSLSGTRNCQDAVDCFVEACGCNSQEGYVGVAYESLGLVCRNLYPQLVSPIHLYLSQRSHELLRYFWHGVGRAIYFSPLNFVPLGSATWDGIQMCVRESPSELANCNALAGFVWALTLVNMRYPDIIRVLLEYHSHEMPEPQAFINGVYSSVLAWRDSSPQDNSLEAFVQYRPNTSAPGLVDVWNEYVGQPCRQALRDYQALSDARRLGTIFCL